MKLLPETHSEFSSRSYWDDFFVKTKERDEESFEWYGAWGDLKGIVDAQNVTKARTLVVGCGNSKLSEDMYDDGFKDITSVDFSEIVIKEMAAKAVGKPGLVFKVMDMLDMDKSWNDNFDVVFDKGVLDAVLSDTSQAIIEKGTAMLDEVIRVLKPGGTYYCVTLAQEHILQLLFLKFQSSDGFRVNVHAFEPATGSVMLPFLVSIQKLSENPAWTICTQLGSAEEDTKNNFSTLKEAMDDRRLVYHLHNKLQSFGKGLVGKFALWPEQTSGTKDPRFFVSIVDSGIAPRDQAVPCGVLLVPAGREVEWTFSSEEGQLDIAKSNRIGRLIVVSLGRQHEFTNWKDVQDELNPSMGPLAPPGTEKLKIPYMTVSSEIGSRKIVAKVQSDLSGELVVEDVQVQDTKTETHRRLVFMQSRDVVQSEARMRTNKPSKGGKGKGKKKSKQVGKTVTVDSRYLAFDFHRAMVSGLFFIPTTPQASFLVVGLGGGALATYLSSRCSWFSPNICVDAVELDPVVADVATNWFGFQPSQGKLNLRIQDGLEYLRETQTRYAAVFLDVDAKDLSQPVLFPPLPFIEVGMLEHIRDSVLVESTGVLVLNLACKSPALQKDMLAQIRGVFNQVVCIPMQSIGDINCIVFAFNRSDAVAFEKLRESARKRTLKVNPDTVTSAEFPHDFEEQIKETQVVSELGDIV